MFIVLWLVFSIPDMLSGGVIVHERLIASLKYPVSGNVSSNQTRFDSPDGIITFLVCDVMVSVDWPEPTFFWYVASRVTAAGLEGSMSLSEKHVADTMTVEPFRYVPFV
jgi:hypothetical protein